jgi:hypothetical protein
MLGSKLRTMPSSTLIAMAMVTSCSFSRTCRPRNKQREVQRKVHARCAWVR